MLTHTHAHPYEHAYIHTGSHTYKHTHAHMHTPAGTVQVLSKELVLAPSPLPPPLVLMVHWPGANI